MASFVLNKARVRLVACDTPNQACLFSEWFKDLFLLILCHIGFGVAFAPGTVTLNIKKFLNLRYIMPDGEIFILIKQKHSHRILCKIFLLNYMVKSLKKYL